MPGEISRQSKGPSDRSAYIPEWLYKNGPKMCPCGHHEGYHDDNGNCLLRKECHCSGIPEDCTSSDDEMDGIESA